jgi:hypothetical protein
MNAMKRLFASLAIALFAALPAGADTLAEQVRAEARPTAGSGEQS